VPVLLISLALAGAAEQIPWIETGEDFTADVDAVIDGMEVSEAQTEKIQQAKEEFTRNREKLKKDLVKEFTESVGKPDEVFGELGSEEAPEQEVDALRSQISRFKRTAGRRFRISVLTLERNTQRDIAGALGSAADEFTQKFAERRAAKASEIGRYALGVEDRVDELELGAERLKRLNNLLTELKESRSVILEEYKNAFEDELGDREELRKVMQEGTKQEKTDLLKKINEYRTRAKTELGEKYDEAIEKFETAAKEMMTDDQRVEFNELVESLE
jgi:hypothetical protein